MELHRLTSHELLRLLRSGSTTVEDVAIFCLARIRERQTDIVAWVHIDEGFVLEEARKLDKVPLAGRGPLHGLPVGVKDVFQTKDMPTCYNSPAYVSNFPAIDAAYVSVLRASGALIFGKTQTTQFAATFAGTKCANPHDLKRTPGGSSSGSAAAIADYQVPLALGTQTAGSVIRPSSFTGAVGFKPTWGAISTEGVKLNSVTLDTVGIFSRSVDDIRLLAPTFQTGDSEEAASTFTIKGSKFGVCRTPHWDSAGPGTRIALEHATLALQEAGAIVEDLTLPPSFDSVTTWHSIIQVHEARVSFLNERMTDRQHLASNVLEYWNRRLSKTSILEAYDGVAALRPLIDSIAAEYSAILVPSAVDEAPMGLDHTGSAIFNALWTVLHVPVINLPGAKGENGLPVGVSLLSSRFNDLELLRVAQEVAPLLSV